MRNCMKLEVMLGEWTVFGGSHQRGSSLRYDPSSGCLILLWRGMRRGAICSHGRVFGRLKFWLELVSLCGRLLLEGFSRWIIFGREV
jgi:hypothetical protein